jgi:hypothetical protein
VTLNEILVLKRSGLCPEFSIFLWINPHIIPVKKTGIHSDRYDPIAITNTPYFFLLFKDYLKVFKFTQRNIFFQFFYFVRYLRNDRIGIGLDFLGLLLRHLDAFQTLIFPGQGMKLKRT